ncbi:MAG: Uma2 family endonuclease [Sphingobacteriales bacterium]|nr:MAG: Uma2 family endonuclease [Sphingobacteriales bacterium]
MENAVVQRHYTFEEYWEMELQSEIKHEFIDGQIIAMPGVKLKHNKITLKFCFALMSALENSNFEVFMESVKLQIESKKDYTYPDICVASKEGINPDDLLITNAVLVVEVLSEGTKLYDKVDKFLRYKKIPTLQYYVLVDTDTVFVDVYRKLPDGEHWEDDIYTQLSDTIPLPILGIQLNLTDIYEGISF